MTEPAREADEPTCRDNLTAAIYDFMTNDTSVAMALEVWRLHADVPDESRRMWLVLQHTIAMAIDAARHMTRREP